jgi:hypothetical protein
VLEDQHTAAFNAEREEAYRQLQAARAECQHRTTVSEWADCLTAAEDAYADPYAPAFSDLALLYQAHRKLIAFQIDEHRVTSAEGAAELSLERVLLAQALQQRIAASAAATTAFASAATPVRTYPAE